MIELQNVLDDASIKLSSIPPEIASRKKTKDKWSQKEILGHLIDSANVNYYRFIRSYSKNDLVFKTYPQDIWVDLQSYNNRDWNELINLWKSMNLHILALIQNIPENKKLQLTDIHNFNEICWKVVEKDEKSSLDYLIKDYIGHLKHHLNQILNY